MHNPWLFLDSLLAASKRPVRKELLKQEIIQFVSSALFNGRPDRPDVRTTRSLYSSARATSTHTSKPAWSWLADAKDTAWESPTKTKVRGHPADQQADRNTSGARDVRALDAPATAQQHGKHPSSVQRLSYHRQAAWSSASGSGQQDSLRARSDASQGTQWPKGDLISTLSRQGPFVDHPREPEGQSGSLSGLINRRSAPNMQTEQRVGLMLHSCAHLYNSVVICGLLYTPMLSCSLSDFMARPNRQHSFSGSVLGAWRQVWELIRASKIGTSGQDGTEQQVGWFYIALLYPDIFEYLACLTMF
jgi:hypothetical protein